MMDSPMPRAHERLETLWK